MAKTKQQKSKPPKKNSQMKKRGKQPDVTQFRAQLDVLGLKIIQVTADGNCFFRSLADQLEGDEELHGKYRNMVVQYIMKNREMYEPFIEDDAPFDEYCQSMEKDGTWAGHMELQAASLVTHSNICIHRYMSPRWYVKNFDQSKSRMVHLSYHDEEHYNSVRLKEDPCDGPARPIIIKADAELSAASHQASNVVSKTKGGTAKNFTDTGSIKLVMAGSGCEDVEKVKQILLQVDGDVDAAIEFMVADQDIDDDCSAETDTFLCREDSSNECQRHDDENSEQHGEEVLKKSNKHDPANNINRQIHDDTGGQAEDKKIPRNKVCPCGSKKKYKACCGTAKGRLSTKSVVNQTVDTRKVRKDKKQSKKGGLVESISNDEMPDMGALCI